MPSGQMLFYLVLALAGASAILAIEAVYVAYAGRRAKTGTINRRLRQLADQAPVADVQRLIEDTDAEVTVELSQSKIRFIIGAVSNGNACVKLAGLGEYFDFSLSARDAGCAKPEREIFRQACRRAGVAGVPLWRLVTSMSPEELLRCVDFRFLTDALVREWSADAAVGRRYVVRRRTSD